MTQNQRDEILLKLLERDEILLKLLDETSEIKSKLEENIKRTDRIEARLDENIKRTNSIEARLEENIEETRNISRSVAKIEVEHGSKLSALFDAVTVNSEKIDKIQKDVKSIKTTLDRHEDEIFCLKTNSLSQ